MIGVFKKLLKIQALQFIANYFIFFMLILIKRLLGKLYLLIFIYITVLLFSINCHSQTLANEFNFNFNQDELNMEIILSKYIQFESVSGMEKEAGEFLKNLCEDNDLYVTQMGDENGNYNFAASIRPLTENIPNIIFLNHIDVIPSGDLEKWEFSPFSGAIIENEIWGRGAFDNKGPAIMQLASIVEICRKYKESNIPYNVTFLAVSCEESQCDGGVKYVVENYFEELNPTLIIGEGPPELSGVIKAKDNHNVFGISVAHKRAFWVKLEIELEAIGHSSVTPIQYANKEMVTVLNRLLKKKQKAIFNNLNTSILKQLGELEKGFYSFVLKHPKFFKFLIVPKLRKQPELFSLFSNSITLTSIDSNINVVNVIPNKIDALLDCRLLPSQSRDEFLQELKRNIKSNKVKITILNEMPEMVPIEEENIFYTNLKNSILKKYPDSHVLKIFVPSFNDTGIFRAKGVTALSCIPIKMDIKYLDNIHKYNERIPRDILIQGKDVYFDFVETSFQQVD